MNATARQHLHDYAQPAILFLVVWAGMLLSKQGFHTGSVFPVIDSFSLLGLVAAGLAVTMIAREIDLAAASIAVVGGIIAVKLEFLGLYPSILVASLLGMGFGALQGYFIHKLKMASIVFTVGTMLALQGVAYMFGNEATLVKDITMGDPLLSRIGPLSLPAFIGILTLIGIGGFLGYTKWGREIYAMGGDPTEAVAAGVNTGRAMVLSFAISGACAALAGSLTSYQSGSAAPEAFGELLFTAVSAALIGGISVRGGRGTLIHVALGMGIIASISAGCALRGIPNWGPQLITGSLLVAVILGEWLTNRLAVKAQIRAKSIAAAGGSR
jgi:ribose transport system permease protein